MAILIRPNYYYQLPDKATHMRLAAKRHWLIPTLTFLALGAFCGLGVHLALADDYDPTAVAKAGIAKMKVGAKDWPQWGGSPERNNVPATGPMPTQFNVKTGANIRWSMPLGSDRKSVV